IYKKLNQTETNEVEKITKIVQFKYDNLDRRIQKIFNNESYINYYYSNKDIILEENYTKNNKLTTSKYYTNGNQIDDVISMEKIDYKTRKIQEDYTNNKGKLKTRTIKEEYSETNTYYYHKNNLNSIVAITDEFGNILEAYEYDVFGKPYSIDQETGKITNLKQSSIGNTRLFTGREYERGLKLYYNRARYYNPELGRFISRDPIDISDDVNLYSYVGNNGVNFVDPLGTDSKQLQADINNGNKFVVELVARKLDIGGGGAGVHTFILITSIDENNNTSKYSIGGHEVDGKLVGKFNEDSDLLWDKKTKGSITLSTDNPDFTQNILDEYYNYNKNNQKKYAMFSADDGYDDEGNCNNFSTTILYRASSKDENVLDSILDFDPKGANPGLGEYFIY
ncbi:MAG: RHS repeat-associated core domain-containing protein, partial [Candidatus Gracilibacteria bacterium]|nr:RHS repeat-associated core domain-containing protein [Candidatus Gracilibacteria bacterium]